MGCNTGGNNVFDPAIGESSCPTLPIWEMEDRCWLGIPSSCAFGVGGSGCGCDIGCYACEDLDPTFPGHRGQPANGNRWLRPMWGKRTRTATGDMQDLDSADIGLSGTGAMVWKPLLMPWRTMFLQRAACYKSGGIECWDDTSCDCYPDDSQFYPNEGGSCGDGSTGGQVMTGSWADEFFYGGHLWQVTRGEGGIGADAYREIYCRTFQNEFGDDTLPKEVESRPQFLGLPYFLRSGSDTGGGSQMACTFNPLVTCLADPPGSECNTGQPGGTDGYIDPVERARWRQCGVQWGVHVDDGIVTDDFPRLKQPLHQIQGRGEKLQALTDIRNQALLHIVTQDFPLYRAGGEGGQPAVLRFDRMEQRALVGFITDNDKIDKWGRSWGGNLFGEFFNGCVDLESPAPAGTMFLELPDCYLKNSGCPVTVKLVLSQVDTKMGMVPALLDLYTGTVLDRTQKALYPFVKVQINADIAPRAFLTEPCEGVEIFNVGDSGHSSGGGTPGDPVDCVANPESPECFDVQSPRFEQPWSDNTFEFNIPDALLAITDVAILVRGVGDFDAFGEYVTVSLNGVAFPTRFLDGTSQPCSLQTQSVLITRQQWNEALENDFSAAVEVSFSGASPACPGEAFVDVRIQYTGSGDVDVPRFCSGLPEVAGDEIVYVHNGVVLDYAPTSVRWKGSLGTTGEHQTRNYFGPSSHQVGEAFCAELQQDLSLVSVWGKQNTEMIEDSLYQGSLSLDFTEPL